jgi:hypothetical protein
MKRLSGTGTKRSPASARSPSLYLSLACLFLAISAWLSLTGGQAEVVDEGVQALLSRGWVTAGAAPCEGLAAGFYELDAETGSMEFLVLDPDSILASRAPPWPDPPYSCRSIRQPSLVEEI